MNSAEIADYILQLVGEAFRFPRDGMFGLGGYVTVGNEIKHGRFTVSSKEELIGCLESSLLHNCLLCTHSEVEQRRGIISTVFIDLDLESDLDLAKKYALKSARLIKRLLDVKPLVQFSGFKGFHILLPCEPRDLPGGAGEAKEYLRWLQERLSYGLCDKQILGDLNRLFRIPWTLNSKIVEDGVVSRRVEVIQDWCGNRADLTLLYGDFKISKVSRVIEARMSPAKTERIRGYEWIEKLLNTPIPDGRKICIGLAIAPYLVKVRDLEPEEATKIIEDWLSKCDKLRRVDQKARYLATYQPRYIERKLIRGEDVPIISFKKLSEALSQLGVNLKEALTVG
jgi:hypothetical protein